MRYILLIAGMNLSIAGTNAQVMADPFPKTISVTGSAEMEIVPDQIYVNITLREYQKKGEPKKNLDGLKNSFLSICSQAGIKDSLISIFSYTGYNNYLRLKKSTRKDPDLLATITYQVQFSSSDQMDALVDELDDEATQGFDIVHTTHSRITEYRKELKIKAVKAAKDKAVYLAQAIGENPGVAISVKEPAEPGVYTRNLYYGNSNEVARNEVGGNALQVDFKKMKLRYEVSVVFALQ